MSEYYAIGECKALRDNVDYTLMVPQWPKQWRQKNSNWHNTRSDRG
ncbi:hypothetical protein QWZ16_20390 [Vibrio ostreicida]|uniref:Uncharacterized protein n=1 Tax=Vibrio ostreicida TaxID=526588 RepID=A0ABT8BZY1_9VIBR|nr:hypothetical protein [Vibrio ostreicida]MDN3611954.1 hypothetical protein [Vibrio ostreicida]